MFKRMLRWLLRTMAILVVLVVIGHIADWWSHRVAPGSVIVLTLKGPVIERGSPDLHGLLAPNQTPLNVIRRVLDKAAADPRIAGLAVKVIDPRVEFAQAQELIGLIHKFAAHHKWTTAYLETAGDFGSGNMPYMVASATSEVSMMPQGEINLMGVGMREIFARGLLDKIGVRPNFQAIGQYKSAANIFTQKDFTPGQHEEDEALVNDLFTQLVNETASQRNLQPARIRALIDQAPLSAEAGLKAHLVDRLEYEDQFTHRIKNYKGRAHALIDYTSYAQVPLIPHRAPHQRIAIVYAGGAIQRGQGGFDPLLSPGGSAMGSDEIVKALNQARDNESVRAVVLRVDSPGGSVIGSEIIRRAAELLAAKKPLVVSMSGFAASGGYWISTPAARIVAEPGTITGSIGVLGGKFNIAPMMTSLGVNTGEISLGANATMFDAFSDFTPAQQAQFRDHILGDTYRYFVSLVAHGRDLPAARVEQIAQGRVWTGEQAIKLKLVDQMGGLDAAVKAARKLAKVPAGTPLGTLELPVQPGLLTALLHGKLGAGVFAASVPPRLRAALWMFDAAQRWRGAWLRAALCPVAPVI